MCCVGLAFSKTQHNPLPQQLLNAKTAFVDNQSGYERVADEAYDELSRWGRFSFTTDLSKADVIIRLNTVDASSGHGYDCRATLSVISPEDGSVLWSNTRQCHTWKPSVRPLVKDLHNAFIRAE
jgi:hypothetical protein